MAEHWVEELADKFREGVRVLVGVPLLTGGTFQEWGVVSSLEKDLLELELSRDFLPRSALLEVGVSIDLGLVRGTERLRCRGIVIGGNQHRLVLQLVEGITRFEPREFYRQDVYLPLDYRLPPRQSTEEIREHWRQMRWGWEFITQEPEPGESAQLAALREEIRQHQEKKKAAPPVAVNISGGGIRLEMKQRLRSGMLMELSIFLPQPQKVIEIVAEVVQVTPSRIKGLFSTALRYRFIEEGDRDRLIGYIAAQQLMQLAQQAPKGDVVLPAASPRRVRPLQVLLVLLILALCFGSLVRSVLTSRERGEKHEIERLFEQGIFEFLKQRR
jgi:hypothetical protein